jgi:acetylornithine deacetylase/succinyl-diaminopimelate desuccinylase-like protein
MDAALEAYLDQQEITMVEELMTLIRIPSISQRKANWPDTHRVLEAMAEIVKGYGFQPEIVETAGCPAFIATLEVDPERPWLIVYNHMDVQPADEPQWHTMPFEPILKDGRIYGRGSTDDKGPALTTLHAIHFLHTQGYDLPNIQLVYETEEEHGSTHFGAFLDEVKERIHTPASILVSDTIFEGDHPAITYRLKGLLEAEAELITGTQDLHSGMVGGAAMNPLNVLIQALSRCVDARGNVTIPGIQEELPEVSSEEQETLAHTAKIFNLEKLIADTGEAQMYSSEALELLERIWVRPTFEVHGFEGAQSEPDVIKTALPYAVKAKLTMRLVAGQEPERVKALLEQCLQSVHPNIHVNVRGALKGYMSPVDNVFMVEAVKACEKGFGKTPVFVGSGGTIGAIPEFERVFPDSPIVLIAQSLMSDGYHAPNENFQIKQLRNGTKTMAHYLSQIAYL